jgi:hypothetical protein
MTKLITAPNKWRAASAVNEYIQDKYPSIIKIGLVLPCNWENVLNSGHRLEKEFELGEGLVQKLSEVDIIPGDSNETIGFWKRYLAERLNKQLPDSYISRFIDAYKREEAQLVVAPNYMKEQMEESLETKAEIFVNCYRRPDTPSIKHRSFLF